MKKPVSIEEAKILERESWSEKQFTAQVIAIARGLGWRVAHFRPAKTAKGWRTAVQGDGAGFPDLLMFRRKRKIAWELKVKKNIPSLDQLEWLSALELAGFEIALCYPRHWDLMMRDLE